MAQKKKVTSAAKAPAKAAARKAPAKAIAAATSKATVKAKAPVAAAKAVVKPAAPVKAKATVAAAKSKKAAPLPIKTEAKPVAPAATPKKISAGVLKAALATAKSASAAPRAVPAVVQKPGSQKLTAPLQAAGQAVQTPKAIAEKAAAARQMLAAQKKPVSQRHGFKANEFIVYPAHGVGRIIGIEEQEIAGMSLELFVINFEKEKLTLRVPTGKLESVGMRKLADDGVVKKAMEILKGRARIKRTMWSRRAQEYVAKINSGDLISIAEVVRDLYRSEAQPEQSYSERQLYEDALDRMAREIAAVERLDERGAVQRITDVLSKSAKSRRLTSEGEAVGEAA
ncbi:MAG: CarD family transcriptional regulator [Hyphomicrobiaceae bacterium]